MNILKSRIILIDSRVEWLVARLKLLMSIAMHQTQLILTSSNLNLMTRTLIGISSWSTSSLAGPWMRFSIRRDSDFIATCSLAWVIGQALLLQSLLLLVNEYSSRTQKLCGLRAVIPCRNSQCHQICAHKPRATRSPGAGASSNRQCTPHTTHTYYSQLGAHIPASAWDHTCLFPFSTATAAWRAASAGGKWCHLLAAPNFRCLRKYIMQLTTT